MNTATYMMAIPFTIIYKGITNSAPFKSDSAVKVKGLTPVDEVNIAKGVMMIVGGIWMAVSNAIQGEVALAEASALVALPNFLKRIIT
jgi:hypothetical protein